MWETAMPTNVGGIGFAYRVLRTP